MAGQHYSESITALVSCASLTVPAVRFAALLARSPAVSNALSYVMLRRAQMADELAKARYYPPEIRLARALLDLADRHGVRAPDGITIPVELSQEELAGLIEASRSTIARALSSLREHGLIHTGYRRITITSLKQLRVLAAFG